jgi:hypothetical protein
MVDAYNPRTPEDEFKTSLGYLARPCLKKRKRKGKEKEGRREGGGSIFHQLLLGTFTNFTCLVFRTNL